MSHGAIAIANDGKFCKVTNRRQGLVTLAAANTIQALTTDASIYFQKLWIYPGKAIASGLLSANSATINVGDNGQQYASGNVTALNIQPGQEQPTSLLVNANVASHGFNTGDYVTIANAADAAFNGTWRVTKVDANNFTYMISDPPKLTNPGGVGGGNITYAGWQTAPAANQVTPDALATTDLPLKYELPLGQSQPLASILIQGAMGDGVFYRLWA